MDKKPTNKQISAWFNLTKWSLSTERQLMAIPYITACISRSGMSKELGRIRKLYIEHKLDEHTVLAAPIWDNFKEEKQNA